ncbi:hypothetical protein MTE01_29080 [Microbacterium testaceum]|uniref:Uncharacterized protein n=1 Tax=Microbacterium testaceum TaxID=2033 RepID=A0A4Y3QQL1_MICTE|nr:hypothetical protein [Microbacterium testaceum]GEB46963.1 hypothetical protein MTE01_29080 [Microbacterium testaceum]
MSLAVIVALWALAAWMLLGVLATPFRIGKPRDPLTPGVALGAMLLGSAVIAALVTLAVTL